MPELLVPVDNFTPPPVDVLDEPPLTRMFPLVLSPRPFESPPRIITSPPAPPEETPAYKVIAPPPFPLPAETNTFPETLSMESPVFEIKSPVAPSPAFPVLNCMLPVIPTSDCPLVMATCPEVD